MKQFVQLFHTLDQTTKTNAKVQGLVHYFQYANDSDKLWTIALLSHRRPRRTVNTRLLREWAAEVANLPQWLFDESYHIVGDLAETISLLLPKPSHKSDHSLTYWIEYIERFREFDEDQKRAGILRAWDQLDSAETFLFNKLITGGFRMGVSQKLMTRALAKYTHIDENKLARKLMGNWSPSSTDFQSLIYSENELDDLSKPYPFYLAYALDIAFGKLGSEKEWQAERKWDGIRGQLIKRNGHIFLWSRGEELITHAFPEFEAITSEFPDGVVLDGEILPFANGRIGSFQDLQKRIGRKKVGKKILQSYPCVLRCYDLLEYETKDIRQEPLTQRRTWLKQILDEANVSCLQYSANVQFETWAELAEIQSNSRAYQSEGLMLKRKNSSYLVGRKRGDWWKWKVEPLVIDAVMIYAQRGHGRRANLFSDYTFAVWNGEHLIPFAKAYSGLTDSEFREVTQYVKNNTTERFGPVRAVKPNLVFEIAFEGIQASKRHKSGVALRFPRISRWRKDKHPQDANTYADLLKMLEQFG